MEDKQQHIQIEKIKLLYQHSLIPVILSGVAGLFLVAALCQSANRQRLIVWLLITILLAYISTVLITKFQLEKPQAEAVLKW